MTESPIDDLEIDEAAVLRACDGDLSAPLNCDEVLAVVDRLHGKGESDRTIGDRLGVSPAKVQAWRAGSQIPHLGLPANRPRVGPGEASQLPSTPGAPVPGPQPLAGVSRSSTGQSDALSVDALANAAARSTSKRTQALGAKLADLAIVVRQRLAEERRAAEKAEQNRRERELAAAEVTRLEEALRAAREKIRPQRKHNVSEAGRANIRANAMKGQQAGAVESPCRKGCGFVAKSRAGRAGHERHCGGAS